MALKTIKSYQGKSSVLTIRTDLEDLAKELKRFSKSGLEIATVRSINRGLKRAMTVAKKEVSTRRNLTAAMAKQGLTPIYAKNITTGAAITGKGAMLPLTKLAGGLKNPKQNKRGVNVRVRKGGKKTFIEGAFIARMPSSHIGVFMRKQVGSGPNREKRLPIQEQKNPSVAHTLLNADVVAAILARYEEAYAKELEGQLSRAVARINQRVRT